MPGKEGEKPRLELGDTAVVQHINLMTGEVMSTEEVVVEEVGEPQVVDQVGRVQITTTEYKLRPVAPDDAGDTPPATE